MSVTLNAEQKSLIEKIASENGFNENEFIANPGSEKGDNFMGIITTVTIKNGEHKLDLILKSAQQNEGFRKAAPLREAYLREIYLYKTMFQEFHKLEEEYNILDTFKSHAKLYGSTTTEGYECLVMDNLKTEGYGLWDKTIPMNSEHISAVLKEYAKFHAISFAFKQNNPDEFSELTKELSLNIFEADESFQTKEKMETFINTVFLAGYKVVENEPDLVDFLKKIEPVVIDFFFEETKNSEYRQVLIHGDCWCNNVMFKYNDNSTVQPSSLKLIDWQLSCISSPAYDFCYFFLVHSSKETLDDYRSYLKLYHDTLSKQLRNFNCDPDEVFSYSEFEEHINRYMVIGFYMSLMILKLMLADVKDLPDFAELSGDDEELFKMIDMKVSNFETFRKRIRDILVFIKENEFVSL